MRLNGGLLIRYLWTQGTDSIHGMRVVNTGSTSYHYKSPYRFLETTDKAKKKKYLNVCLKKRRHFTPFVVSVDVFLGVEAEATLKRIASRLATKWKEPYSLTCRYVKSSIVITLIWVAHCCIRGGFRPLESACNAPIERTEWAHASIGKIEGPAPPSSDYASLFTSPFLL